MNLFFLDAAVPFWAAPYGTHIPCPNAESATVAYASLMQYVAETNLRIDGVVTFDDYAVVATAYITSELGLPGITPKAVRSIKHKYTFRKCTAPTGVLSPQTLLLPIAALKAGECDAALATFPYPCVLKPVAGAGSKYVRRITDAKQAKEVTLEYYAVSSGITCGR